MGSVNLVVIVESARSLITHTSNDLKEFHLPSIIAVAAALCTSSLPSSYLLSFFDISFITLFSLLYSFVRSSAVFRSFLLADAPLSRAPGRAHAHVRVTNWATSIFRLPRPPVLIVLPSTMTPLANSFTSSASSYTRTEGASIILLYYFLACCFLLSMLLFGRLIRVFEVFLYFFALSFFLSSLHSCFLDCSFTAFVLTRSSSSHKIPPFHILYPPPQIVFAGPGALGRP